MTKQAEKPQEQEKPAGLALLREPFPANMISVLPKPYKKDSPKGKCPECGGYHGLPAAHLSYVGHAALTDRLLDADPNWNWEPVAFGDDGLPVIDRNGGMWIRLTVCGVTRLGYGTAPGKSGPDVNKELIGDALRNAAMRFGAALDLWHKGDWHEDEDDNGHAGHQAGNQQPGDEPKKAPENSVRDYVAALEGAETLDALQEVFKSAYRFVEKYADPDALKRITEAKDSRKVALAPSEGNA